MNPGPILRAAPSEPQFCVAMRLISGVGHDKGFDHCPGHARGARTFALRLHSNCIRPHPVVYLEFW